MSANIATITAKGQITIPKAIRQALNIREQDRLLFMLEGEQVILIPIHRRSLSELYGVFPPTKPYTDHATVRQKIRAELGERIARGDE